MQQIADWLEKLGMSEYAQRCAENDIDFENARRCIAEATTAVEATKERCWEAEVDRVAGETETCSSLRTSEIFFHPAYARRQSA
jgi:hypothetical protein